MRRILAASLIGAAAMLAVIVFSPASAQATTSVNGGSQTIANNATTCPGAGCLTYGIVNNAFFEVTISGVSSSGATDTFECVGPPGTAYSACAGYPVISNVVSNTAQLNTNTDGTFFFFTPNITSVRILSNGSGSATNQTVTYLAADTQSPAPIVNILNWPSSMNVTVLGGISPAAGATFPTNVCDITVNSQCSHVTPAGGMEIAGVGDVCLGVAKTKFNFTTGSSGWNATAVVVGTSGENVHICELFISANGNVNLSQATHGNCNGVSSATAGPFSFTTNQGVVVGDGSADTGYGTTTQGDDWCADNVTAGTLTISGTYVYGP